ncbi:invasion associated locus B family protein [Sinisalibacter aestuarii]|uniref:Invasion-associated locus B family protein n=1 Tax=Sinisalibacter aestuarii TaxID=2949426 RepID=A0ABQ5LR73_9RHOB|nr:invasion associated locus B family protein [Sinisalibacter aestuarii]GKY87510.1 invasion-associated locus B family protein [Sinisalibacter aestuarii]
MQDLLKSLSLAALLAVAGPAFAQDSTEAPAADAPAAEAPAAEAPATEAPLAEAPASATGAEVETYIDEQFDDWQRECLRLPEGVEGTDPCRMVQIVTDAEGKPIGKIALGLQPAGSPAVASAEVALPLDLGILLSQGLSVGVDEGLSKQYDFYLCLANGCTARLLFNTDDIQAFKAGTVLSLGMIAFLPPERQATRIAIPVSLKGFTKAYESLTAPEAPAEAPAAAE